jgi:hypothetical protein
MNVPNYSTHSYEWLDAAICRGHRPNSTPTHHGLGPNKKPLLAKTGFAVESSSLLELVRNGIKALTVKSALLQTATWTQSSGTTTSAIENVKQKNVDTSLNFQAPESHWLLKQIPNFPLPFNAELQTFTMISTAGSRRHQGLLCDAYYQPLQITVS